MNIHLPECCYRCESRTVRRHCVSPSCPWVECVKCKALSGRPHNQPGSPLPTRRASFRDTVNPELGST
jgi:hypothetical protein